MDIAIIGAGAAGCFAAINIKQMWPEVNVTVYEGGPKALAKVSVTGGGRCNLTNSFEEVKNLISVYPRGEKLMKRLLREFSPKDLFNWFEHKGVSLITQKDQRVFPLSGSSMEIVNTLLREMKCSGVHLKLNHRVNSLTKVDEKFYLNFVSREKCEIEADIVVVVTGGCSRIDYLNFISTFRLEIVKPVPSLFSLCLPHSHLTNLMGISVENVIVTICGTKFRSSGPLLITHWGISGPAILKISSYAARYLAECNYNAQIAINWLGNSNEQFVYEILLKLSVENRLKQLQTVYPPQLNARLWEYLLKQAGLNPSMRWSDLGKKGLNRLVSLLTNNIYSINGKNRFKEEFVTCGGVSLSNVNSKTLECRSCKGLYFAGEILDVDAITGGFNLQAAWTMGYVVAKSVSKR